MLTFDDLVAIDSTVLLRALTERLARIELNELESKCLLPRLDVNVKIYGRLQALLAAARRGRGLEDTVEPLREIWLPGDGDPEGEHAPEDPGDLMNLGRHHALLAAPCRAPAALSNAAERHTARNRDGASRLVIEAGRLPLNGMQVPLGIIVVVAQVLESVFVASIATQLRQRSVDALAWRTCGAHEHLNRRWTLGEQPQEMFLELCRRLRIDPPRPAWNLICERRAIRWSFFVLGAGYSEKATCAQKAG